MSKHDKGLPPIPEPPEHIRGRLQVGMAAIPLQRKQRLEWIAEMRAKGYTDKSIATAIGIKQSTISTFARKYKCPRNIYNATHGNEKGPVN